MVQLCLSQEVRMSSILTFSNRSVKLFTLKNRFLITAKVLHSIRMCLTVQVVWLVKHCGCGSCFKMKEWVSLVWPIRNRDITKCSLLDFLDAGLHSPKVDWIWKSLLWMLLHHCCCNFVWRNLLIVGFVQASFKITSICQKDIYENFKTFASNVVNLSKTTIEKFQYEEKKYIQTYPKW